MKRYWVPKEWIHDQEVHLEGDVFHHIHKVCRNSVGAKFEILFGEQRAYFVELTEATKKSGRARILEEREIAPLAKPYIHLALSIPRFHKMDTIIEKAVELGVYKIHPFVSEYSFVRKIDNSLVKKQERWQKIIRGATQQSGRGDLMEIDEPQTLSQLLQKFNQDPKARGLFPYEGKGLLSIYDALNQSASEDPVSKVESFWLFVGSEGGFSHKEVESFQEFGLDPLTLGEQILRVDTACLALVSIIKYQLKLWGGDS